MHPSIFHLGPLDIRSYGLMLAIGFLAGITLAAKRAEKDGGNPDHIYDLSIWVVISALIGARVYYIVTHFSEFAANPSLPFFTRLFVDFKNMFWPFSNGQIGISGLVLLGGLLGATAVTAIYLKMHKLSIPRYMDYIGPSLGLGEFFTRIGCFLNGCCYGKPTDSFCGIVFPDDSAAGMFYPGMHIHPTQLYQSLAGLLICVLLIYLERYRTFYGFTSLLYFMFYSIARFATDFFRYYEPNLTFFGLSHNQLLSLAMFTVSVVLFVYFNMKFKKRTII